MTQEFFTSFAAVEELPEAPHVVIVGGGITGLSAAFYLQRAAEAAGVPLNYTLVERDTRFGGKLLTERHGDFVVEGGPDSILTQKPWGVQLVRDLGLSDQLIATNEPRHKVYVLAGGRPRPMPDGMMLIVPTELVPFALSPVISPLGKLRMALDLVIPPRRDGADETMADFIRRRLGAEALDRLAEPLLAGIHNSEAERQSILATFPRLRELEEQHGSLIRGMLAQRRKAKDKGQGTKDQGAQRAAFVTFKNGIGTLVDALVEALYGRLIGGCGVTALERDGGSYRVRLENGETLHADAVILTAPAFAAADLVAPLVPALAAGLRQIRYVTTGTVSLAYRRSEIGDPLGGFGLVIPRTERRKINAVTISSSKFTHRAPDDAVLLRAFVGGSRNPGVAEMDDAPLEALVRAELRDTLGIEAEPLWSRIFRWPQANPQYDVGHIERADALRALCPPGLWLAGSGYHGVGIPDCVRQGQETAAQAFELLSQASMRTNLREIDARRRSVDRHAPLAR